MSAASTEHPSSRPGGPESRTTGAVRAMLTFMMPGPGKPYIHTEALTGAEQPRYFADMVEREVEIRDGRAIAGELSLDRQGFQLLRSEIDVGDLRDDAGIGQRYYPEVERLIAEVTGATRVILFDHTRRSDVFERGYARTPASRAHNDYTERSGPQRVRDVLGTAQARALAQVPVAQINVWRPVRGPVRRSPLALLDATSLDTRDLLATDLIYPDRVGEIYHLAHDPRQRWYYFPAMTPAEAILIKGYDSRTDGRARFTPHTAFTDPGTPAGAPPRESIEVRALAWFE